MSANDILAALFEVKRERCAADARRDPYAAVARRADARLSERRGFAAALAAAAGLAVIAEVKRASPSAGTIVSDFDPARIAGVYDAAGADAISVLTEESAFLGDLAYLDVVRAHTTKPILRKDFLSEPYQLAQAAAAGADAVLLIVAGLSDDDLAALALEARRFALDTLVEVHDDAELARALAMPVPPSVIGVNNRDLRTFATDLATSERLVPRIPPGIIAIAESGVRDGADAARLRRCGARGVLVGESLMRAADPAALLGALKRVPVTA